MKFVVGLAPGGAVDPYARIIAERMAKALNRAIIVENRPGATGNISAQYMIEQPADGQLIWVGTQALTEINPSVFDNLKLEDRRLRTDHQRRAGAARFRRASERAGQQLRGIPRVGQGQSRQAELFVVHAGHAVALPRLSTQ